MVATFIDRKKHAARRHIHSQVLSASAIRDLENTLLANIRIFASILDDGNVVGEWGNAKDVTNWLGYLVLDNVGSLTFSQNWNLLRDEENRPLPGIIAQGLGGLNLVRGSSELQ